MTSHHITIHSTRGERIQEGRRHNPYTEAGEGDPFFKLIARFAIEQTGGAAPCALDLILTHIFFGSLVERNEMVEVVIQLPYDLA